MPPSDWLPLATFTVQTGTLIGAIGLASAALWQARTARKRHEEQTRADRERRIIESFAKACEQLGSDKLESRLGAIYTLDRLAEESVREYEPIMKTLTAFVREHAPWQAQQALPNPFVQLQGGIAGKAPGESIRAELVVEPEKERDWRPEMLAILTGKKAHDESMRAELVAEMEAGLERLLDQRPATDIQAILTVMTTYKQGEAALDLAATDLRAAILVGANLRRAHLMGAHLEGAHLQGAHLEGAHLLWAHLKGADLRGAVGLTQEQLAVASGDAETKVAKELRPEHWPAATELRNPRSPA